MLDGDCLTTNSYSSNWHLKTLVSQSNQSQSHIATRYLLLCDSYGLVLVGRPLWREDGSVFFFCGPLPAQSFSGPSPLGLQTIFYCLSTSSSSYESESYVTTDGQPASLSWNKAPFWGLRPDLYYCLTVAGLLIWGDLSLERPGLSFTIPAGSRQRSQFLVRVP
jgi:hypothetical protein